MFKPSEPELTEQAELQIRECIAIEDLDQCIRLQREAFGLKDLDVSPRRHLVVSRRAGGWTLGAFAGNEVVGFVHQLVALRDVNEIIGYSHMLAVARSYQNRGVGARLKWAQRERAISEGRRFITWTWDPMQARNAHFNLNRLGATVHSYGVNFYGAEYNSPPFAEGSIGIESDRLFADWDLLSKRVSQLEQGLNPLPLGDLAETILIPSNWERLVEADRELASQELFRVRTQFQKAFTAGLVCAGFERDAAQPRYLLYDKCESGAASNTMNGICGN